MRPQFSATQPQPPSLETIALNDAIDRGARMLRSHQTPEGYWWYTLEANESIGAEAIFCMHIVGIDDPSRRLGLARRIMTEQRADGSWALTHGGPGDLSITIECYLACRMAGYLPTDPALTIAKNFIRTNGGIVAARVFTKIHLAMLGLGAWDDCPAMPVELMMLPARAPFSIYSFSSWARACVVPLLIILAKHPVWAVNIPLAEELSVIARTLDPSLGSGQAPQSSDAHWIATPALRARNDMMAQIFFLIDRQLKLLRPFVKRRPTKHFAIKKAAIWIREHIAKTEDIFPALSYGAIALRALGHDINDPTVRKAMTALQRFQHSYTDTLPSRPFCHPECSEGSSNIPRDSSASPQNDRWRYDHSRIDAGHPCIHQQCCISPVWDTPWAMVALQSAEGVVADAAMLRAGAWLLDQQITAHYGDWRFKNPRGAPGGWAFEFENEYFPDVDDTIQVLLAIHTLALPETTKAQAMQRGLAWCLSMQNSDGGWGAFDKNNTLTIVNKIPFADHGACLDPATPDITGRMLELLAVVPNPNPHSPIPAVTARALAFLRRHQQPNGSWFGRWGVNYIYGTWAVLRGLQAIGIPSIDPAVQKAADWLESIQRPDGGFAETVAGYASGAYTAGTDGVPSQTAWALMGLIAAGRADSPAAVRAAQFLIERQRPDGTWDEPAFTGTGFPGHFYIRYHGYRHYFPLLALAEYRGSTGSP